MHTPQPLAVANIPASCTPTPTPPPLPTHLPLLFSSSLHLSYTQLTNTDLNPNPTSNPHPNGKELFKGSMTFKQRMSSARKLLKPMKPIVRTYGVVPASRASKRRKKRGVRVIGVRVTRASGGVDVMFIMHTLMGSCKPSLIGRHQKWLPQLWTCLWMLSSMPCALMMNMPAAPLQSQSGFRTPVIPNL